MSRVTEQEVQDFLTKTEIYLADIPMSERQTSLSEWKEKIKDYMEAFPEANFTQLKLDLGGPKVVSNLIRFQNKAPLKSYPKHMGTKIILLIFSMAIFTLVSTVGFLWWKFTPIFSTNDERTLVLGGLIDIDRQLGQVKVGDTYDFSESNYKNIFEGTYEVPINSTEDIALEFDRGQLEVSFTDETRITWSCKVSTEPSDTFIKQETELVTVSLRGIGGSDCNFKIPSKMKYTISGDEGRINVIAPPNDTFIQLGNGSVNLYPDSEQSYRYDLKVSQGIIDPYFDEQTIADGLEIKVELINGTIQKK